MSDHTALVAQNRDILEKLAPHVAAGTALPVRFACDFARDQTAQARAWLSAALAVPQDALQIEPASGRRSDVVYHIDLMLDAVEISRLETLFLDAAARFQGSVPSWEIGPQPVETAEAAAMTTGQDLPLRDVSDFDTHPEFAELVADTTARLATMALSARRLNDIRVTSRFSDEDAARVARRDFAARYSRPEMVTFATSILRYSTEDTRISLYASFESRRPDPVLIARLIMLVRSAAQAHGGEPPTWYHDDWRRELRR